MELRQFAIHRPGAGEALIKVECCTLCGSDLHTVAGRRTEVTPSILGHEILGVVEEVGEPAPLDVERQPLRPGARITWSSSISCGTCDRCQNGLPQKCRTLAKYGHDLADGPLALSGGLAEFLVLRRGSTVIHVPENLPAELVCPVNCATATISAAFRAGGAAAGKRILILGGGMLGLTSAAYARSLHAAQVTVCDDNPERLGRARSFGADHVVVWDQNAEELRRRFQDASGSDLFDLVLELSGSPDAVEAALRHCDVGAHAVLVGSVMPSRLATFDPETIVRRWVTVKGVHNYAPQDLKAAVSFLQTFGSTYPFASLVEEVYSLAEVNLAIEQALKRRPFRIAIRP